MCGIVGVASEREFLTRELLDRLKLLEYRGYDSFGYWDGKNLYKRIGRITGEPTGKTKAGIAHTRWATNGPVTINNTHPHKAGNLVLVHNGIITNTYEIREVLGCKQTGSTDSELIAHFLNQKIRTQGIHKAIREAFRILEGTYAILFMMEKDERLFAIKKESPLVVGLSDKIIAASDTRAFRNEINKAIFLKDNEYAIISPGSVKIFNSEGRRMAEKIIAVKKRTITPEHKDHMLKEILEEPEAAKRACSINIKDAKSVLSEHDKIILTGCGTALLASKVGALLMKKQGIHAEAINASEFHNEALINKRTIVVGVSQSGETMDTLRAMKWASKKGASLMSIINNQQTTIDHISRLSINIMAGEEVAVASTKAFINQAIILSRLAGFNTKKLPGKIISVLKKRVIISDLVEQLKDAEHIYIIGRGLGAHAASEIALKIKEVSYIHAEGLLGGELKHGTLALITEGAPIISIVTDQHSISDINEAISRGAEPIIICSRDKATNLPKGRYLRLDSNNDLETALLAVVVGQLLAHDLAVARGCDVDKPRNLAKSVTVS